MQIVQYVYWDKPGEKDKLNNLLHSCTSEMQLRKRIAEEFQLSYIEAGVVFSKFKDKFNKILNK